MMTTTNGIEEQPRDSSGRPISAEVASELQRLYSILNTAGMATRVWQQLLSDEQRQRLGNDLAQAYSTRRTVAYFHKFELIPKQG